MTIEKGAVTEAEIYDFLAQTLSGLLDRPVEVHPATTRAVAGWDSFVHVSLLIATEERFGFEFSSDDMDRIKTAADYVAIVMDRLRR